MKVIINADDFGYNHEINCAIEKAIIEHKISSTTIIANSPAFDEAVNIAKKYKQISYGVHLNLIEFSPLSDCAIFKKYKLVDENGVFVKGAIFSISLFPEELKSAIKKEWEMQIHKVLDSGVNVSHIDSHQHTHAINSLENVVIDLLEEFDILCVRRQLYMSVLMSLRIRNYQKPIYSSTHSKHNKSKDSTLKKMWRHMVVLPRSHRLWIKKIKKHAKTTDYLFPYQIFVQEVQNKKSKYANSVIEVECHPGLDPNKQENEWMMRDALGKYVSDYQLINYSNF